MNRLAYLGLGATLGLLFVVGALTGMVIFFLSGGGLDVGFAAWGCALIPIAWVAFVAFRRAFKSPRKSNGASKPESVGVEKTADAKMQTADEKLAALLKPPEDSEGR